MKAVFLVTLLSSAVFNVQPNNENSKFQIDKDKKALT